LPYDSKRFYPVCTGGKRPAPPDHVQGAWDCLEQLDANRYPPLEALRVLADVAQVVLDTPAGVSIREAIGDLNAVREATDRLEVYEQFQPGAFRRRHINAELRTRAWKGTDES
jgi:hypothetical protein